MKNWSRLSKWAAVSSVLGILLTSYVLSTGRVATTPELATPQSIPVGNTPFSIGKSPSASNPVVSTEVESTHADSDTESNKLSSDPTVPLNDASTNEFHQAPTDRVSSPSFTSADAPREAGVNREGSSHLSNDEHYVNVLGHTVHSPAYASHGEVPAGASALCRDGSYSFSESHRGTCSHHGGVATWLH